MPRGASWPRCAPTARLRASNHDFEQPHPPRFRRPRIDSQRVARFARTERGPVTLALGAAALHVADDNFLQPEPGTSPFDPLASALIPIGFWADPGMGGEDVRQPKFHAAAGQPKQIWQVPGADHTGGLKAQPAEYERRVVGFFDRALLDG